MDIKILDNDEWFDVDECEVLNVKYLKPFPSAQSKTCPVYLTKKGNVITSNDGLKKLTPSQTLEFLCKHGLEEKITDEMKKRAEEKEI